MRTSIAGGTRAAEPVHADSALGLNGGAAKAPDGTPTPDPRVDKDLEWWEKFRIALQAFPPPPADAPFIKLCEQFGLTQADSPYVDMDPEQAAVLIQGAKAGQAKIDELMKRPRHARGLAIGTPHLRLQPRLLRDRHDRQPEWKIPDRKQAYVTRAIAARGGLWGNHGYEADYALIWVDADGDPSTGPTLRAAPREDPASRRVLVAHDVPAP